MNKTIEQTITVDQESVSRLAYQLWENAGRPAGRDLEFWLAAEAHASAAAKAASSSDFAPKAPDPAFKSPRSARGGIKKTWPKPYPSLPKF
jgi:hypothetical protein